MSIKVGDWVSFRVASVDSRDAWASNNSGWIKLSELAPIPPPDPHQALKDAVVATSLEAHKSSAKAYGADYADDLWRPHAEACDALLAAPRPPSKYAGLRKAMDLAGLQAFKPVYGALDKLEAEERERG